MIVQRHFAALEVDGFDHVGDSIVAEGPQGAVMDDSAGAVDGRVIDQVVGGAFVFAGYEVLYRESDVEAL